MEVVSKINDDKKSKLGIVGTKLDNTLRNQILVWRLAIGSLFVGTMVDITFGLNSDNSIDMWDTLFKMGVGIFMLVLYTLTYKIGHWDDLHNSNIDLQELQQHNVVDYTKNVITYITEELVPNMEDEDKKMEIIKSVPNLLGLVSIDELTKNMGLFQQSLVESLSIFETESKKMAKQIITDVKSTLNIPKPDARTVEEVLDDELGSLAS